MESLDPSSRYLFSLPKSISRESFGLHRMQRLVRELGRPERAPGIIHVAGTNGKGSTSAMIESGLRAAGHSTGLYTSPHLCRLHERFLLNGEPVSDEALAEAVEPVRRANERIVARHGTDAHPTFFESATAVALVLFDQAGTDFRIVETGLGGRLDATNVVAPELVVFTHVDHDHERYLGRNLAQIASEKGAIAKRGSQAVIGTQAPAARRVLLRCCQAVGARIHDVAADWDTRHASSQFGRWRFHAVGPARTVSLRLGLAGRHQVDNALTAVAALVALGIASHDIERGLHRARWPGRLEFAGTPPRFLLDAAHNPDGARALAEFVGREAQGRRVALVYGSSRDKAVDEIAGWMFPAVDHVVLTRSKVERSVSPRGLLSAVGHHHRYIETAPDVPTALQQAAGRVDISGWIVVAGSIFLVGEARALLG